jgi:hypothetical protein
LLTSPSYTSDPPTKESSPNKTTCAKKTELALVAYIQFANGLANGEDNGLVSLGDSDVDNATGRPANRNKRRRLNPSNDVDPDSGSNSGSNGNDEDVTSGIQSNTRSSTDGGGDQESKEQKMVTALTDKIQKALDKKFPTKKKKKGMTKVESKPQMQSGCADVVVSDFNARGHIHTQTGSTNVIVSDFNIRFARGEFTIKD